MPDFRVTKYNPDFRGPNGEYQINEWTDFTDIGRSINDHVLTFEEYLEVERKYIQSVLMLMDLTGVDELTIFDLEVHDSSELEIRNILPHAFFNAVDIEKTRLRNYSQVRGEQLVWSIRLCLMHECWCRLEGESDFFIHFGHDFYMFIGSSKLSMENINLPDGIYVEEFTSPYRREYD